MDTYQEGYAALYICLTVLNLSVIGTAIYYVWRIKRDDKIDRIKINVLVESLIEIFTAKQDQDVKDNENRTGGGIPRRD